jgi:hypothetical protein
MDDDRRNDDAEIAAIFTRLKEEVRSGPSPRMRRGTRPEQWTFAARARAERAWAVTAERPFEQPPTRGRRVQAFLVVPVKRVLRKLMRWYVEPVAAHQRSFNLAILTLVDELAERIEAQVAELERRLDAIEGRRAEETEPRG